MIMGSTVWDNGAFQIETDHDGTLWYGFGQEYSFTLQSLAGLLQALKGLGLLDEVLPK